MACEFLNDSPTKQKYSFPKAQRFIKPYTNCDSAFYDPYCVRTNRACTFGYGTKFDFTKSNKPNAGFQYDIESAFTYNHRKQRGSTFGQSRDNVRYRDYHIKPPNPGPGQYESQQRRYTRSHSLGLKTFDPWIPNFLNDSYQSVPGPGHYQFTNSKLRGAAMQDQQRRFPTQHSATPGPAVYKCSLGSVLSKHKTSGVRRFGSEKRNCFIDSATKHSYHMPGPGCYESYSQFDNGNVRSRPQTAKILILFATQTGSAEYYAEEVGRKLIGQLRVKVQNINNYDYTDLPNEPMVIFLISTTGDGDMPTGMFKFWQFLLIKDLPKTSLQNLQFSVFGLGDSSYAKFNYGARKLRNRILQLGAIEIVESAFGDEMHPCGIDTEFIGWLNNITNKLRCPQILHEEPTVKATYVDIEYNSIQPGKIKLLQKTRLTPLDHSKSTYQYIFQCPIKYDSGDILRIKPVNSDTIVQSVLSILQLNPKQVLSLEFKAGLQSSKSQQLPTHLSIVDLLRYHLDLSGPPSRYFIRMLSNCVDNPIHRDKLLEMSAQTSEGLEAYYEYVYREKRNVAEILFDFQPCHPTVDWLIESLRLIRERDYSISTAYTGESVGITVALVNYTTAKNRNITGFCSKYLDSIIPGDLVQGHIIKGSISFPKLASTPVIMVGPGTGVAPLMSYLQTRVQQNSNKQETILIFGACYKDKEFYYQEFYETHSDKLTLYTAFSRDQQQKIYVQHKIIEQSQHLSKLIRDNMQNIVIIVTGTSRKMPEQVENAFKNIVGEGIINQLKKNKQYIIECW